MHALFAVIPILTFQFEECRFSAPREATIDATEATILVVSAGAGAMRIEGKAGLREARIRGQACASDRTLLEDIELSGERVGNEMRIHAHDRELELRGREYARLNVVIEVPADLAARIQDGSGDMELIGLGSVDVRDGSGDVLIQNISGDVTVDDEAGQIRVAGVRGNVNVVDTSGEIEITQVQGTVDVRDGSGAIKLARIGQDVLISDGSGDIEVEGVEGDLTIRSDSNGHVDFRDVRGTVRTPANRDYHRSRFWLFR